MGSNKDKSINAFTVKPDISSWTRETRNNLTKKKGGAKSRDLSNGEAIIFTKHNSYKGEKKL